MRKLLTSSPWHDVSCRPSRGKVTLVQRQPGLKQQHPSLNVTALSFTDRCIKIQVLTTSLGSFSLRHMYVNPPT